jgi:hypothetical protein
MTKVLYRRCSPPPPSGTGSQLEVLIRILWFLVLTSVLSVW